MKQYLNSPLYKFNIETYALGLKITVIKNLILYIRLIYKWNYLKKWIYNILIIMSCNLLYF